MTTPTFLAEIPDPWASTPDATLDAIHMAMLDELAPGWDVLEGSDVYIESRIDALAGTLVYRLNERFAKQLNPLEMLDLLPTWEQATGLRPNVTKDDTTQRRKNLAAKLRGIVGNTIADIGGVALQVAGDNYVGIATTDAGYVYWPGINPGPPGMEFAAQRCTLAIVISKTGLTEAEWIAFRSAIHAQLDDMRPAWLRIEIGEGTSTTGSWIVNQGIVNQTFIG